MHVHTRDVASGPDNLQPSRPSTTSLFCPRSHRHPAASIDTPATAKHPPLYRRHQTVARQTRFPVCLSTFSPKRRKVKKDHDECLASSRAAEI